MSKQRRWQFSKQAAGLCICCGKPKEAERMSKRKCASCQERENRYNKIYVLPRL